MKVNAITKLDLDVDQADVVVEVEGRKLPIGKVYQLIEGDKTVVVLVTAQPRKRKKGASKDGKIS